MKTDEIKCPCCKHIVPKLSPNTAICWTCFDKMTEEERVVWRTLDRIINEVKTVQSALKYHVLSKPIVPRENRRYRVGANGGVCEVVVDEKDGAEVGLIGLSPEMIVNLLHGKGIV